MADDGKIEVTAISTAVLGRAREIPIAAPAFFKTRVLATLEERQRTAAAHWWRRIAVATTLCSMGLLLALFLSPHSNVRATIGQPIALRISVDAAQSANVAQVEVILPEGVQFYSAKYPELGRERELSLSWDGNTGGGELPVVLRAISAGKRTIHVRFYDANRHQVAEKAVEIHFDPPAKSGMGGEA